MRQTVTIRRRRVVDADAGEIPTAIERLHALERDNTYANYEIEYTMGGKNRIIKTDIRTVTFDELDLLPMPIRRPPGHRHGYGRQDRSVFHRFTHIPIIRPSDPSYMAVENYRAVWEENARRYDRHHETINSQVKGPMK